MHSYSQPADSKVMRELGSYSALEGEDDCMTVDGMGRAMRWCGSVAVCVVP